MPSMSYCMFENTTLEMDQILNTLEEALERGQDLKLSRDEQYAYDRLVFQCKRFLRFQDLKAEEVNLADSCYIDADDLV
jgi:hypothetical protein